MRPDLDAMARDIDTHTLDAWCHKVDELTAAGLDHFNAVVEADVWCRRALQESLDRD